MTAEERREKAETFRASWGIREEDTEEWEWMLWDGWVVDIGCEQCQEGGPSAPCWGRASCHGYDFGCGCRYCAERERRESVALEEKIGLSG